MMDFTHLLPMLAMALVALVVLYLFLLGREQFHNRRRTHEAQRAELAALKCHEDKSMSEVDDEENIRTEAWAGFRKFKITRKVMDRGNICSFYLSPYDGRPLPAFRPGQYLTFQLKMPGRDQPSIRVYSLSDSPNHEDYYRVSIQRQDAPSDRPDAPPGVVSTFFHRHLHEGDIIDVKAPSGDFYLDMQRPRPVVLIGFGLGFTSVLSMLNAIAESDTKQETWFFLEVRNSQDHVMKEHLQQVAMENENIHLRVCYSDPLPDDKQGEDYDLAERVRVDLLKRVLPSSDYEYYFDGPPWRLRCFSEDLAEWGVQYEHMHCEAWSAPPFTKKERELIAGEVDAEQSRNAEMLSVTFAKSSKTLEWDPDQYDYIIELAEDHGIHIDYGCRMGVCGTCETAILAGEVHYKKEPEFRVEEGSCLPCSCVPKTDLTLDA